MNERSANLAGLIEFAQEAVFRRAGGRTAEAARLVFQRLAASAGERSELPGERLPVCHHNLSAALAGVAAESAPLPEIAGAIASFENRLRWARRKGASPENIQFYEGHANTMLIGPGGLEQRDDVMVGMSLMAPNVLYPDHNHPPEEVYLALTDGEWWNAEMAWTRPGPGGLIYNPPGILHAMRSGPKPFLALWLLPL